MEEVRPKYSGKTISIGDVQYILPSLSIKQAKEHWSAIQDMAKPTTSDKVPARWETELACIHAALSRNYPNLKLEDLEDQIEMANIHDFMAIVCAQSGLDLEPSRPGSEPVAAPKPIGAPSTASSSSEPAGPSNT